MARLAHPLVQRRPVARAFEPVLRQAPAGVPPWAYDQYQAAPRWLAVADRLMGFRHPWGHDFVTKADWASCYSSISNIKFNWRGEGRRLVLGIVNCLAQRGSGFESEAFQSLTLGEGVFTPCISGALDLVWDRLASFGKEQDLSDVVMRLNWEGSATYFPWKVTGAASARDARLAWRHTVLRMKCPTYDPYGTGANPNAQFAADFKFFFNPECGTSIPVPGSHIWPGTVVYGEAGTSPAPPSNATGLIGDWFRYRHTGTGAYTCWKKTGSAADQVAEAKGVVVGTWTLQSGVTEAVIPFPDAVSSYLDAKGRPIPYVDVGGSEAYASNYRRANNTPELLFINRTIGVVERDLTFGPFTVLAGPRANAITEGVGYWLQFMQDRGIPWAPGEWGAGMKVDYPVQNINGKDEATMRASGMGAIFDNPHHIRWMAQGMRQHGAVFHLLWDHDVLDFQAGLLQTPRLTGLPAPNGRTTKELMARAIVEEFGRPGKSIRPYDESNEACGAITVTWLPGFEGGVIPLGTPLGTAVATCTIANAARAKRVCWCTFGADGTGYGRLAFRDGLLDDGNCDFTLRQRLIEMVPGANSIWVQAGNEIGPFSQLKVDFTVT